MKKELDQSLQFALNEAVERRVETGKARSLLVVDGGIDFSSNDYLGLATEQVVMGDVLKSQQEDRFVSSLPSGATGSRLLAGNSAYFESLERFIANFHQTQKALLFNSGYDANLALFSCIPQPNDIILYDSLIHASVHDGFKLSRAQTFPFRHSDVGHLKELLGKLQRGEKIGTKGGKPFPLENASKKKLKRNIIIAVESVYSMDGDYAPLKEILDLAEQVSLRQQILPDHEIQMNKEMNQERFINECVLIVDEAHSTGVDGIDGRGLVSQLGLSHHPSLLARLHTFGKALGCHGAVVVSSTIVVNYLINYARPFIYSTALPLHSLITIFCTYKLLESNERVKRVTKLKQLIERFRENLLMAQHSQNKKAEWSLLDSLSPIQGVILPGNKEIVQLGQYLQQLGFDVRAIRSPTVPTGTERIRICLHSHNTLEEVDALTTQILKGIQVVLYKCKY